MLIAVEALYLCNLTSASDLFFPNHRLSNILVPMIKKNRLFTPGPTPLLPPRRRRWLPMARTIAPPSSALCSRAFSPM